MQRFFKEPNSQKWMSSSTNQQFVLTIADMDLPFPSSLKRSVLSKIQLTNNFTYKNCSKQYFQSIVNWYTQRHLKHTSIKILPQDIVESPSIINIIYLMIQSYTKEGDGILLATPVFFAYSRLILQLKRRPVQTRLYNQRSHDNTSRYGINFDDLEQKAKQSKMMIFCNPHNPTGRIWNKEHVEKIVNICHKNNLLLLSDEILCDLLPQKYLNQFYSLVNSDYEKLIVCNSISKAFNVQSLKGGYAIIKNKQIRGKYNHLVDVFSLHINQFALKMTEVVYSEQGEEWIQKTNQIIKNNYNYLVKKTSKTMLIVSKFEGCYLIVLIFQRYIKYIQRWWHAQKPYQDKPKQIVKLFLSSKKIAANQLPYLGPYQNYFSQLRFTIAVEQSYFKRFVDTLVSVLQELQQQFRQINAKL